MRWPTCASVGWRKELTQRLLGRRRTPPLRAGGRRSAVRWNASVPRRGGSASGSEATGGDAGAEPPEMDFAAELYGEPVASADVGRSAATRRARTANTANTHGSGTANATARWTSFADSGSCSVNELGEWERRAPFVSRHFRLQPGELVSYLERKGLQTRVVDQHAVVRICPFCPATKGKADNLFKLYVHTDSGVYFCHRCGAKGNHWDLKYRLGDVMEPTNWRGVLPRVAGDVAADAGGPAAETAAGCDPSGPAAPPRRILDPAVAAAYEHGLSHSTAVLQYLAARGLSVEVARKYRVGAARLPFPDDVGGSGDRWTDHDCVTFPWIVPEWSTTDAAAHDDCGQAAEMPSPPAAVLRVKIRSITRKSAMRLEPRGGVWGLFGLHTVPADAESVVLTEGEFDAMAVHQATGMAAVSLPNGARSLPPQLLPLLEGFRKIYLWLDDDIPGQEGACQFARKLGMQRCLLVGSGNGAGPKDANEALLKGMDLQEILRKARPLPHERIVTFAELRDEVQRELANPQQVRGIQSVTLPGLNRILKGHRRGELSVFTGPTGIGKTTVLSQMSLDFCQQGANTLWGSFEISNVRMAKMMLSQYTGISAEQLLPEFDTHAERFERLPLYFLRFFGSSDVEQVIHAMEYAAYVYDVSHVVLDNLQFMTSGQGRGYERFEIMDRAVEKFRLFATHNNVHVSLVIHPRKEDDDQALKTSSVFGSAKATQEADNVIIVQNGDHFKYLDVRKNRFDGELGRVPYRFDTASRRIVEIPPHELQALEDGLLVYT
ncbi:hypothetical protein CDCA_CDCA02G0672 [Cyanidium caldarium]|uniref:SF4 helicase domain-containing protein n=1 Tax=Cyanidium caldarium TaxID=2771 RepID=A0AAV9IQS4_CYACA|nr:hypothetical protein CDCA_CDCA02G0672 [Cyanidium caldarium]